MVFSLFSCIADNGLTPASGFFLCSGYFEVLVDSVDGFKQLPSPPQCLSASPRWLAAPLSSSKLVSGPAKIDSNSCFHLPASPSSNLFLSPSIQTSALHEVEQPQILPTQTRPSMASQGTCLPATHLISLM